MATASKSTIANLEAQAQKTQEELAAAEAALARAVEDMEAPPVALTDDQVGDLVSVKNICEVRLVKARAAHRRADLALTEAKTAAAEKDRRDSLARVGSMGVAAQKQMQEAITTAAKQLRAAMRSMAEAELAREELNRKLPDDEQIPEFESAVLTTPSVPRKEISRVRELHWLHPSGRPYDPEYAAKIKINPNGSAYISNDGHTTPITRRRFFDRVQYSDWLGHRGVSSLASTLALPGLKGAPNNWTPMRYATPQTVLNELDRIETYRHSDPVPEIKEELEAISPVFDDEESMKSWEAAEVAKPVADGATELLLGRGTP